MSDTIFSIRRQYIVNGYVQEQVPEQEVIAWLRLFADTYLAAICKIVESNNAIRHTGDQVIPNTYTIVVDKKEIRLEHDYITVGDVKDNLFAILRDNIRSGCVPNIIPDNMIKSRPTKKTIRYYG